MKQYCDHMGVTDRYTGYRNNLNRGRKDPVRLNYQWMDTKPNEHNASLNVNTSYPGHHFFVVYEGRDGGNKMGL